MDEKNVKYDVFIEYIREHILEFFPEEYKDAKVIIKDVYKNNDSVHKGLYINIDGEKISPIIYLEQFYERYENNESLANIGMSIYELYKSQEPDFIVPDVKDFDAVKNKIVFKLINTENNKESLKGVPSIPHLDMSAVFRIQLSSEASIVVSNELFNMWSISKNELGRIALENTRKLNAPQLIDIESVIGDLIGLETKKDSGVDLGTISTKDLRDYLKKPSVYPMSLFVITTKDGVAGANAMLLEDEMKKIASAFDNSYYIIPSSIHELIVVECNDYIDPKEIKEMICSVNSTSVEKEDKLSDNLYKFDNKEKKLVIVKTEEAPKLDQKLEEDISRNVNNPNQGKSR